MKLLYLVESGKSKFLVFDEMPDKISTKYGDDTIIGRIGGVFYDFLAKRNERREAFGGRKFDVVLDNGEVEKCEGQWWDAVTDRAREELEKEGNPFSKMILNQKGILKIEDGLSAWENQIEKYRFATKSERQKLVDALKASKEPKAKEYLKRFFGIEEKPKYEFKPFDKVLVRKEGNKKWNISLFAREIVDDYNRLPYKYECSNGTLWDCCIPFEGNEHLLGTNKNG